MNVLRRMRRPSPGAAVCLLLLAAGIAAAGWMMAEMNGVSAAEATLRGLQAEVKAIAARTAADEIVGAQEDSFWAAAEPLARSVETGHIMGVLEAAARSAGITITLVEPGETAFRFYQGHLRASPYRLEILGTGPGVEAFAVLCENLPVPGEVRQVTLQTLPDDRVRMGLLVLLYSLNPPQEMMLPEPSAGRVDVFRPE